MTGAPPDERIRWRLADTAPGAGVRGGGDEERPAGPAAEGRRIGGGHRSAAGGGIGYALVSARAAPSAAYKQAYDEGVARDPGG
jgi:hypothetical protein